MGEAMEESNPSKFASVLFIAWAVPGSSGRYHSILLCIDVISLCLESFIIVLFILILFWVAELKLSRYVCRLMISNN